MQAQQREQLKSEVQEKCIRYDYIDATDISLSEFIVTLVEAGKSPDEFLDELNQLVETDHTHELTQWIYARKNELENPQTQEPLTQQQSKPVEHQQPEQMDTKEEDSKAVKLSRENRIFNKALGGVFNRSSNRSENSSEISRTSNRRSRSRSRSPESRSSRYKRDSYSHHGSRHDDRNSSSRHEDDRKSTIFSRLGHSVNPHNSESKDRVSVFDRLGGSRPVPVIKGPQSETPKERCKYWPTCKNGDQCPYFHPTTVCPDFPNCPNKSTECMFIHPEVAKPVMPPTTAKVSVPCRFFPYCSNPACPFMHPPMPQPYFMQSQPSFTHQKVQIPCKNGDNCTRPDCHFVHPKDPSPQSEVICKFDGACTRPNCFYKHTKENQTQGNKTLVNNNLPSLNNRQFSVAEDDVVERIVVGDSADLIRNEAAKIEADYEEDADADVVMDVQ